MVRAPQRTFNVLIAKNKRCFIYILIWPAATVDQ